MSEIPEDILEKARIVYDALETTRECFVGTAAERLDIAALARALMEAIEAERERCAKIAEGWPVEAAGNHYQTNGNGRFWDADTIYHQGRIDAAAAIRDRGWKNE